MIANKQNGGNEPEPVDPKVAKFEPILQEAKDDIAAGCYPAALDKIVWCYENASTAKSFKGFVWKLKASECLRELATVYSPAVEQRKRHRDAAREKITERRNGCRHFLEFASINRELGEEALTRDAFLLLAVENSKIAQETFRYAWKYLMPLLIESKDTKLIEKYLDPDELYGDALERFLMRPRHSATHKEWAEGTFTHACATLIAVLVINGNESRAKLFAVKAKMEWGDQQFHDAIDSALRGELPNSGS